jgi:hypothetical protein
MITKWVIWANGRLLLARVDGSVMQASENLHICGHDCCNIEAARGGGYCPSQVAGAMTHLVSISVCAS